MKIVNNLPKFIDIDDKATDSASGSFICVDNSSDGYLIDFKAYGKSEQKQYDGRNLIPYPHSETTHTKNGITWTDNGDGTITANGTVTNAAAFYNILYKSKKLVLSSIGTKLIFSGKPTCGAAMALAFVDDGDNIISTHYDNGTGVIVTVPTGTVAFYIYIYVGVGVTLNNVVFKPMLRLLPNLLPYPYVETTTTKNGITWTDNEDTTITANGTATALSQFFFAQNEDGGLKPNTTYILTGCPSGGSNSSYGLQATIYGTSSATKTYFDNGDGITFTTPSDYSKCMIKVNIQSDTTVSDLKFNPYLMKVETEEVEYEPYVGGMASPNPEYPQDINSVGDGGTLNVKITGKNLIPMPHKSASGLVSNGVTWTVNEDYSITANGTATADSIFLLREFSVFKGTYTISGSPTQAGCAIQLVRASNWGMNSHLGAEKTITYDNSVRYTYCRCVVTEGITVDNVTFYPMLRPAEITDNTYEPYKESITTIPLTEPLRGVGDVKDEIACRDGVYGVLRHILQKIYDGTEGWAYSSSNDTLYLSNITVDTNIPHGAKVLCSHFVQVPANDTETEYAILTGANTNIRSKDLTSKADWLAWLSANPITVDYVLTTPIFEPFEDQTPFHDIKTYDGVTCITATDDAEMDVVYFTNSIDGKNISSYQKVVNERLNCTPSNDIKLINVDSNLIATKMGNTVQMTFNYYEFSSTTGEIEINIDKEYLPTIYAYATCMGYDKETSKYVPVYLYLTLNFNNSAIALSAEKIADDGTLVSFTDGAIAGTITYFIN